LLICKLFRVSGLLHLEKKRIFFEIWNSGTPSLLNPSGRSLYREVEHGGGRSPCGRRKAQGGMIASPVEEENA